MTPQLLFLPHLSRPARGRVVLYGLDAAAVRETAERIGLPAAREAVSVAVAVPLAGDVVVVRAHGLAVGLADALPWLLAARRDARPASLCAWAIAAHLGLAVVRAQRVLPGLAAENGGASSVWWAAPEDDPVLAEGARRLAAAMPPAAHALALDEGVWEPHALLGAFLDAVADVLARGAGRPGGRPRARLLPWTARWAEALADAADPSVPLGDEAADRIAGLAGWRVREDAAGGRLRLLLSAPGEESADFMLAFGVVDEDGEDHPAAAVWGDSPLAEALLAGLARAARLFDPLDAALAEARPEGLTLTLDQAWRLLVEAAPLLEGAGVELATPNDLEHGAVRGRLHVAAIGEEGEAQRGLGGEAAFTWEAILGGELLDERARGELLGVGGGLVPWRGRWLLLDEDAQAALARAGDSGRLPLGQALALALQGAAPAPGAASEEQTFEVRASGAIATLIDRLVASDGPDAPEQAAPDPEGFVGELRSYQRRGVAWLAGMSDLGLGGVLADDMGLGKTVQLIAHLLGRPGGRPSLVVCPTSVVGNWVREVQRFAPGLRVHAHHGADRDLQARAGELVVTSYGTLRRDVDELAAVDWDVLTLDEAQQVKNPETAGARAVRRLVARQVVALTGTPLENRLADLWSLLDATTPGLLGSRAAFGRRFAAPIERRGDPDAARRLRRLVAPFVLRRTKADPEVARDLPPKIERTVTCTLTAEQAALYRTVVAEALAQIAAADGIARRGRILALLTALKQVANHPAQYRAGPEPVLEGRSGKLEVTREIVAEAVAGGERLLVFTQFVVMGHLLARQLGADLGLAAPVPFLHGGLDLGARDRMVAEFQDDPGSPPVLVVSTRAGGLGLNLTAATQVVHYDRWWNPAVEDQATDRTHRIGQTRPVEVHKLVTAGTVEERIAALLERKRALADTVVAAGEGWVTELDDDALTDLVALSADVEVADYDEDRVPAAAGAAAW